MATQNASGTKVSPVIWVIGAVAVGAVAYVYTSGDEASTPAKPAVTAKSAKSTTTDMYLPVDYKASYPTLKIEAKNAFMPLIRKTPLSEDGGKQILPSTITGGGNWSYDGMVSVDNHVQGLLEDQKAGESDYVSVGEHWKHGKIKRITDSEIDITGDDGTTASMMMGEASDATTAAAAAPAVAPLDVSAGTISGPIGAVDVNPLPAANGGPGNNGNGWGNRRRGRNRGGGGFGGGGFGGFGG
jgi:hypothetical protein